MNEITIIPAGTIAATPQEEWLNRGRDIAHRKVALEWDMAEWVAEGVRDGHAKQLGFDFDTLGQELRISPAKLKEASAVVSRFPAALRNTSLSIEHHAALVSLPDEEALPLLKLASNRPMKPSHLRELAYQKRIETCQTFPDDDIAYTKAVRMVRQWNDGEEESWAIFVEWLRAKNFSGIIDIDEICDGEA